MQAGTNIIIIPRYLRQSTSKASLAPRKREIGVRNISDKISRIKLNNNASTTNCVNASRARLFFPSPRYLLTIALPPVPSIVDRATATLTTGYTIFNDDRALLPRKRETNIPSTIVYSDIKTIITIDGAANFKSAAGVIF